MTARATKCWGPTGWAVALVVALLSAGCSSPMPPRYEVRAVFDEVTKPTLPGEYRSELGLLGVAPDGTLYIKTNIDGDPRETVLVRLPTGAYVSPPVDLAAEFVEAMAFHPDSGDVFVLSYPRGRAHIRRFNGDRVVQDIVPTRPEGGNFEERRKAGGDEVGLFYDASSGSLLYADGNLYRIDANGTATIALPKPAFPDGAYLTPEDDAERDNRVAYAVNPRTGTIYVAFTFFTATVKCENKGGAVYRVGAGGRLSHVAGGCVNGDDDYIDGGPFGLAADSTSDDLVATGAAGAVNWISKGKSMRIDFPEEFDAFAIRGVGFDAAGHAYVGAGEKVAKITFRR